MSLMVLRSISRVSNRTGTLSDEVSTFEATFPVGGTTTTNSFDEASKKTPRAPRDSARDWSSAPSVSHCDEAVGSAGPSGVVAWAAGYCGQKDRREKGRQAGSYGCGHGSHVLSQPLLYCPPVLPSMHHRTPGDPILWARCGGQFEGGSRFGDNQEKANKRCGRRSGSLRFGAGPRGQGANDRQELNHVDAIAFPLVLRRWPVAGRNCDRSGP